MSGIFFSKSGRLLAMLMTLSWVGAAEARAETGLPRYFLVHMDAMAPAKRADVEATRAEYRGWVAALEPSYREVEVHFLRVGDGELWALRPAAGWNAVAQNAGSDSVVEAQVRARVGSALDDNGRRMHGSIEHHHNELLRLDVPADAERQGWPADAKGLLAQTQWIVRLAPRPDNSSGEAIEAALDAWRKANPSSWLLRTVSSPGSGDAILFIGSKTPMPAPAPAAFGPASAIVSIRIAPARLVPELGNADRTR